MRWWEAGRSMRAMRMVPSILVDWMVQTSMRNRTIRTKRLELGCPTAFTDHLTFKILQVQKKLAFSANKIIIRRTCGRASLHKEQVVQESAQILDYQTITVILEKTSWLEKWGVETPGWVEIALTPTIVANHQETRKLWVIGQMDSAK